MGMVCAFGQLIKPPLLDEIEMLNVHPSLLPRWRGAAPIERAIMAGDEETGVAIMRLTEGLDSGPVALCERVEIAEGEDYGSLSERLAALGGELAVKALELRGAGELEFAEQPEEGVTYAEKIEGPERRLDPGRSAVELERTVRGAQSSRGDLRRARGRRAARGRRGRGRCSMDRRRASSSPPRTPCCLGPPMEPSGSPPSSRRASGRWRRRTISAATRRRGSPLERRRRRRPAGPRSRC